ncbi:DNA-processing protein DprA [Flammeovirgaceae bacterium SG7u.111]|nr:DNA-processing protein DprA [Flammeovirgaceae bacterium SG7u.132]WPO34155.1 DNA-processing protein DprA [Flammeovirgaceae bacterium SG7u.111]
MDSTKVYQVALGFLPGVGNVNSKQLVSYCGSAENVFKTPRKRLLQIPGVGEKLVDTILKKNVLNAAEEEVKRAERAGIKLLFYTDKNYPERMKRHMDTPQLLYFKGNSNLNAMKVVSVVGTRNSTNYGREIVERLMEELKAFEDILVVSGLAYGIDIIAHREALKNGLATVGVMANGIDKLYPSQHKATAQQMLENGGLLTENKFGTGPDAPLFPKRNRVIASMSDAVIVVEAAAKGGALITANIANSYGVDVFAYPGNVGNSFSEGCNSLLKRNLANVITGAEDLVYMLNWDVENTAPKKTEKSLDGLSEEEIAVMKLLRESEMQIDLLSFRSQVSLNRLASVLLKLEFDGFVKSLPGKKFKAVS